MFGRKTEADAEPTAQTDAKDGGKGRPTPTRKEAEAAARDRAKASANPKGGSRDQRMSQTAKMREAMRTGDDRYLPSRDQGPVKAFVRNWLDRRLTLTEFLMPILLGVLVLTTSRQSAGAGYLAEELLVLAVGLELGILTTMMRRAVRREFPAESTKGLTSYLFLRAIQLRPLRMPKTQVKIGGMPIDRSKKK